MLPKHLFLFLASFAGLALPLAALAQVQPRAVIGFLTNSLVVQETDGLVSVVLYRTGNTSGTNTVRIQAALGSGTQTPIPFETRQETFQPGLETLELLLPVTDNDVRAVNRPLTLSLTAVNPTTTVITNRYSQATITVPDDDAMTFRLGTNAVVFPENSTNAVIEVRRDGNSRVPASVDLQFAESIVLPQLRPPLFAVGTHRVDFAILETQRWVRIPLQPRPVITGPSQGRILLAAPSTPLATFASPSNATLTVLDADGRLGLTAPAWIPPGANKVTVTLARSTPVPVSGILALENGTALAGEDFPNQTFPIEFPASSNSIEISIPLLDNPARTHGRWFRAVLQNVFPLEPSNGIVRIWIPPFNTQGRFNVDPAPGLAAIPTNILAIAPGPGQSWVLAGGFPPALGAPVSNIVRVTRGFTLDPAWSPSASPNAPVQHAAAFPDGRLLAAGDFSAWGDHPRSKLALLEPDGSPAATGTNLDVSGVSRLVPDARGRVYVSGSFTQVAGIELPGLTRFSSTADLEAFFRPSAPLLGAFVHFTPLSPEGVAILRADNSTLFLDDSGASNATVAPYFYTAPNGQLTALPDGSVRTSTTSVHQTAGGSTDLEIAPEILAASQAWSVPSGFVYSVSAQESGWRLTRHWGDGAQDPRFEVWFDRAPTHVIEANDGTVLVSGSFTIADGIPSPRLAQILPPPLPPQPGIRWHAGTKGFGIGERARHIRVPAWRETDLGNAREILVPLPPSPALAPDAPAAAPLRFDAGSRIGWVTVPLRNRTEAGPDDTFELALPEAELTPGAPARVRVKVFRDEQTFGFTHRTLVMDEVIPPAFLLSRFRPNVHLGVRRLTGLGFPGSTVARFVGGTVTPGFGPLPSFPPHQGETDFYVGVVETPVSFGPGESLKGLVFGPYDDALSQGDRTALFTLDGPGLPEDLQSTIVVRDNDVGGPAGDRGPFSTYQSFPGAPTLLASAGVIDGRVQTGYRLAAGDGGMFGAQFTGQTDFWLEYLGTGPGGTHYLLEKLATSYASAASPRLLRHLADGSPDPAFQPVPFPKDFRVRDPAYTVAGARGMDGSIFVLTREGGVQVGGPFNTARLIHRFGPDGVRLSNYAAQVYIPDAQNPPGSATPILLAYPDGRLLVAAGSSISTNRAQNHLIRLTAAGETDPTFNAGLMRGILWNARIYDAALDTAQRCIVAGNFDRVDGVPRPGFARLTESGRLDPTFDPQWAALYPGYTVTRFRLLPDGGILVPLTGLDRSFLLKLDPSGKPDPAFPAIEFDGWLGSAVFTGAGAIATGGDFHNVLGRTRHHEAWFDLSGRLLGESPVALRLENLGPATTRLRVEARATGTLRIERGPLEGPWEPVTQFPSTPGATSIEIPTPAGDAVFLRAIRE